MSQQDYPTEPIPLNLAARCLRLPARWLREEVEAGRIPALIAGTAILIHIPTVLPLLAERAKATRSIGGGA